MTAERPKAPRGLRAVAEGSFFGDEGSLYLICHLSREGAVSHTMRTADVTGLQRSSARPAKGVRAAVLLLRESMSCLLQEEAVGCEHSTATGLRGSWRTGEP